MESFPDYLLDINWLSPVDPAVVPLRPPKNYLIDWLIDWCLLQYFDTVGWVFWPVKTVSHITYTVLAGT